MKQVSILSLCLASLILQCWASRAVFHLLHFLISAENMVLIPCSGKPTYLAKLPTNTPSYSNFAVSLQHAVGMFVAAGLGNHKHVNEPVSLLTGA